MELDQPLSLKGKCRREGGYRVKPTRTKEKRKAKEKMADNNTRANLGCREDKRRN
jgi:hypothetical protein